MLRPLSYAYWALICVTCPFFFVGALAVFLVTLPFDRRRVLLHLYSSAWAVFYVAINPFWKLRVTGREHLPWRGPAVLVANHASLIDILVLFALFRPYKWVSKIENFKLPFVGWNMHLNGYVPLARGDGASVRSMLARCSVLLRRGNPVLFFPEGTRTRDGRLQAFKDGAFELAVEHGVPLIPIAVHGTGRALPKHGMVLRGNVDCHVEVLEPLDPAAHEGVDDLRDEARRRIAAALGEPGR
jgi:1-acyl-sn-glycerol-3-phosphate acyltransferase